MLPIAFPTFMTVLLSIFAPVFMMIEMDRYTRYRPVAVLASLTNSLSEIASAGRSERTQLLLAASRELKSVELMIGRMRFWRGTVPMISSRQPALKRHSRLVISRLRMAAAGLDTDTNYALRELIALVTEIADNYATGHVGRLLEFTEAQEKILEPSWSLTDSAVMAIRGSMTRLGSITISGITAWAGTKAADHFGYHVHASMAAIIIIVFGLAPAAAPSVISTFTSAGK